MKSPIRAFEWELWKPYIFKGVRILELGNKKNANGVYKHYLESGGCFHVSIDINGQDGALPIDLRGCVRADLAFRNLPTEYDVLTNSGVTEHVESEQIAAWRNCYELVRVGGVQIHVVPAAGHWMRHGYFHPKEEFYRRMALLNDMEVVFLDQYKWTPGKVLTRAVLRKRHNREFVYPGDQYLDITPRAYEDGIIKRGD